MTQWPKALCGACVLEFSEVPEVCTQRRTLDLKPKAKELEGKDAVGLVNTQDFLKPCRKQRLWNNSSSYFNLKKKPPVLKFLLFIVQFFIIRGKIDFFMKLYSVRIKERLKVH